MTKLEQFRELVKLHDLTYDFSDDPVKYRAGDQEYKLIQALAKELPREEAVAIWNANVDAKLLHGRQDFYWKS